MLQISLFLFWFSISRNIIVNLYDTGFGNGLLAMLPKVQATKEKI
jgi:hypothetical protein